jgi:uncharacterized protein DUF4349
MRRRDVLDPEAERDLATIDAALAGETVDPPSSGAATADSSQLVALARAVRAERPSATEGFAAELDAWAASGFAAASAPASRRSARRARPPVLSRLRPRFSRRMLLPALGAAASLLLALVIASSLVSGGDESGPSRPASLPEPASGGVADESARPLSAPSTSAPAPADDALAPGRGRRVERQASLVLTASAGDVPDVADGVIRATDEVGGIVVNSSVSSGDDGRAGASFQLRVPTRRLDDALAKLSKLGHVRSRTQDSQDVTGSFVSARERLDESLAERRSLLRRLARADTANETASIRERLRIVRLDISSARAALRRLRVRTDFSAVSVTVDAARDGGGAGGSGGDWTPGDAMEDAVRVLEVFAGVALVTLAVLAPLGLLGALLTAGSRSLRRRRREQALSAG